MLRLSNTDLQVLASLTIDSISIPACGEEVILHKGNCVGMYLPGHGVVLEPTYVSVQRFNDIIKVGERTDAGTRYGAYSITEQRWVVPILYTDHNGPDAGFWGQLKLYRSNSL